MGLAAGCIDLDPLFTDLLGRLAADSPCIGAGWLDAAPLDDTRGAGSHNRLVLAVWRWRCEHRT